jgi:hypothetical protein
VPAEEPSTAAFVALPSALRRQNDAEYNALVLTHLSRSTDVSATIGRDHVVDQLGPAGSAAVSSDSGSDECRRGLMPATLMRCVKSQ